ncbi:MAG TPA: nucleotidyltransferase family protein [Chloroflexota bacterium]|nr:nucleotidyltransferase family protein [Chloroflexota bacterium]
MSRVAGLLLAAGMSTRLGRPKQLLPFRGRTLLRHAAETGLAAGLEPLIVVIGAEADAMHRELTGLPVVVVENPRYAEGQSTSLRAGLAALPADAAAVVALLVDMPGVDAPLIQALVAAWQASGAPIVRPVHAGRPGNPVLFAARLLPELAQAEGDEGGRAVLRAHAAEVQLLPVESPGVLQDVDTWEAYGALVAGEAGAAPAVKPPGR